MRKTKIICTLGPSTDDETILRKLIQNNMDVARINMSHGTHADQKKRADMLKKLRKELNKPVALLLDTKGPEVRTKTFKDKKVTLVDGQHFVLTTRDIEGDETGCAVTYKDLPRDIHIGTKVLIDDGLIELRVLDINDTDIECQVINGGPVSNHKGINVPGCRLSMPYISEQDRLDIAFAVKEDFDFIAASFVTCKEEVIQIREELQRNNCDDIRVISKIENAEGVDNIDEIIRVSDGVMVARGDMGVEIKFEQLPAIQKKLISAAYLAGKQVITATQMLESMIVNPRPTRAETSDVANAIYDGTSAIMLSGETAVGRFPVEAVKTMSEIAIATEKDIDYVSRMQKREITTRLDVTNAISHATCTTAHDLEAVAIMTVSKSGLTARMISRFRPSCPIICGTTEEKVLRQMNLSWGVVPIIVQEKTTSDELFDHVVEVSQKEGLVQSGDIVVITLGVPLGVSGTTNMLKAHMVGDIIIEGTSVNKGQVTGRLCVCQNEDDAMNKFKDGDILVVPKTDNKLVRILRKASGVITEESGVNSHAAVVGITLDIPVIVGAANATKILKTGTVVTLDGDKGVVINTTK